MKVIWDPNKAQQNIWKHNVLFSDAEPVLFDPYAITTEDIFSEGEQRHIAIGLDALGRILVVIFGYRGDHIRLISARRASKQERQNYETGI